MTEADEDGTGLAPSADQGWVAVYRANAQRLVRLATVLVGSSHAADLVADAVAVAVTSPGWAEVRDPGAYLTRSVVNAAHGHHRSEGRRRAREDRAARLRVVSGRDAAGDGADDADRRLDVRAALDDLSPQQRAVVHLHYWDDLTITSIAEVLGVRDGTVRRQLARAKTKLQGVLDER